MTDPPAPAILDPTGRPARRKDDRTCPQCHAGPDKRRLSAGFGDAHDICAVCGYDFLGERTAEQ
jgi:uncharacterized protein (DUF983 family)